MYSCLHSQAQQYLMDLPPPVSDSSSMHHLLSATYSCFYFLQCRLSTFHVCHRRPACWFRSHCQKLAKSSS